jgi:3-dehydroquinate synthase
MKRVRLKLGERSYNIHIGSGAIKKLPDIIEEMKFLGPVVVITDKVVASKLRSITDPVLKKLSNDIHQIVVPATERSKSIAVYQNTLQKISKMTKTHRPFIIALGGGVIGDLGGFVAATYRRGVPYMQVPTTLLAQVDSAIGGKVGIDLPEAKNLVGAFYQPRAVIIDTDFLRTLPRRQMRNGLGEIIKYGIIASPGLFKYLEDHMKAVLSLNKKVMETVITECVAIKSHIVEVDEYDRKDIRIALNFGHTLGHAIEAAAEYSKAYNHGEAVALGMLLSGEIAKELLMIRVNDLKRIKDLVKKAGLPTEIKGVPLKRIMGSHEYDKKFTSGVNRFILPRRIGRVEIIEDIPALLIKTVLKAHAG